MDDQIDGNGLALPTLTVSAADRLRRFTEDDEALAELAVKVHERAMADDSEHANAAAHTDLRIRERRAAMWGYDSPQRYDLVMAEAQKEPDSFERAHAAIMRIANLPAQRALRQRLEQLGPEKALELLGGPEPDTP